MNVADSEVVISVLKDQGYTVTGKMDEADLILVNTCSIRENAEQRIWGRLKVIGQVKRKKREVVVGLIGCMAERLREKISEREQLVDIIAGPDSYRNLPELVNTAVSGRKAINVKLLKEETYSDIAPLRYDTNNVTAFVSIMRGCNNMCAYCVVPYVRGAERSRDPESIVKEITDLTGKGYREVTLIGQNVNSYRWHKGESSTGFPELLERVALLNPSLRVRFSTSHPKDISDELLHTISKHINICRHIHLPAQSGSNRILKLMNREYTREWYLERIDAIKRIIPDCSVSTDMIAGFCTETDEDHRQSLSLMEYAGFDFAYMFKYSERPGTLAARKYRDDVPEEVKDQRLKEMIALQNRLSLKSKKQDVGRIFEVLIEGYSKRSQSHLSGRTSQNKVVVFPGEGHKQGEYVNVLVERCTSATLIGRIF